jgi:hypothetical protein
MLAGILSLKNRYHLPTGVGLYPGKMGKQGKIVPYATPEETSENVAEDFDYLIVYLSHLQLIDSWM